MGKQGTEKTLPYIIKPATVKGLAEAKRQVFDLRL